MTVAAMATGLWLVSVTHVSTQPARTSSAEFETFLAQQMKATAADLGRLRQGVPIVIPMTAAVDREVAMAGVIRIDAPAERTVATISDIERFERGKGFIQTRKMSEPPRLDDFAAFQVNQEDFAALRKCRPADCDVKLGQSLFPVLNAINWSAPNVRDQVNTLARRGAFNLLEAYRQGGNEELAIYADSDRPTFVAREFADLVQRTSQLPSQLPDLARFLLDYPRVQNRAAFDDFYYWSVAEFGLKPVFRLNHVVIHRVPQPSPVRYAVATKQLYANHYFHTALEVRATVDVAPDAASHYLVALTVVRSDGLTGLFGGMVKSKVQSGGRDGLLAALSKTKQVVEQAR
ncbi:MAG: hypothetical protein U0Q55_04495 [Vicinamibacterales bacterium]